MTLPPLPPRVVMGDVTDPSGRRGPSFGYKAEQMQAYARAAIEASVHEDAERYRCLRALHWSDSPLACVVNPKVAVKLGHDCPFGDRLDEIVDKLRKSMPPK